MRSIQILLLTVAALALVACVPNDETSSDKLDRPAYVTLDADLTQLKADFNAMSDKVRLVFISGPSCGICLRGMDDLNNALIASLQSDARIHTLVVQVPTLGAEEKHAAASVRLMPGPRVNHYWDPEGNSGNEFMAALDMEIYAWDVWMVYEPGVSWAENSPPPSPFFWQHQLGPLPDESRLDAVQFASVVNARLAEMPAASEGSRMAELQRADPGILQVAQPRGVMIQSNHESRGGYHALKTIESIRYDGETGIGDQVFPLSVTTRRPYSYERVVTHDGNMSTVRFDGANIERAGANLDPLPPSFQDELLASYEFDGWMTDWKEKGHKVWRIGMKKYGARLPWLMEAELTNGRTWHIYVDSHTGDAFRQALIGLDGQETLVLEFDDYRDVDGFRLAHEVRYFDEDRLLATDRFRYIYISTKVADHEL